MVLMLTQDAIAEIEVVVQYSERHKFSIRDLVRMLGSATRIGDDPGHRVIVPMGFICCFSIEEQQCGWCRHLSTSLNTEDAGRMPRPAAAWLIAQQFGFRGDDCSACDYLDRESIPGGRGRMAINMIQRMEDR